eukprot:SAG11_NODE_4969_length_1707_cov_47.465174_1_plen_489_part_10
MPRVLKEKRVLIHEDFENVGTGGLRVFEDIVASTYTEPEGEFNADSQELGSLDPSPRSSSSSSDSDSDPGGNMPGGRESGVVLDDIAHEDTNEQDESDSEDDSCPDLVEVKKQSLKDENDTLKRLLKEKARLHQNLKRQLSTLQAEYSVDELVNPDSKEDYIKTKVGGRFCYERDGKFYEILRNRDVGKEITSLFTADVLTLCARDLLLEQMKKDGTISQLSGNYENYEFDVEPDGKSLKATSCSFWGSCIIGKQRPKINRIKINKPELMIRIGKILKSGSLAGGVQKLQKITKNGLECYLCKENGKYYEITDKGPGNEIVFDDSGSVSAGERTKFVPAEPVSEDSSESEEDIDLDLDEEIFSILRSFGKPADEILSNMNEIRSDVILFYDRVNTDKKPKERSALRRQYILDHKDEFMKFLETKADGRAYPWSVMGAVNFTAIYKNGRRCFKSGGKCYERLVNGDVGAEIVFDTSDIPEGLAYLSSQST